MALLNDLQSEVARILRDSWAVRDGRVVPADTDVGLTNDAVKFDRATVLYADLSGSTNLVDLLRGNLRPRYIAPFYIARPRSFAIKVGP
jgi:class 3 adenylate cyclase